MSGRSLIGSCPDGSDADSLISFPEFEEDADHEAPADHHAGPSEGGDEEGGKAESSLVEQDEALVVAASPNLDLDAARGQRAIPPTRPSSSAAGRREKPRLDSPRSSGDEDEAMVSVCALVFVSKQQDGDSHFFSLLLQDPTGWRATLATVKKPGKRGLHRCMHPDCTAGGRRRFVQRLFRHYKEVHGPKGPDAIDTRSTKDIEREIRRRQGRDAKALKTIVGTKVIGAAYRTRLHDPVFAAGVAAADQHHHDHAKV